MPISKSPQNVYWTSDMDQYIEMYNTASTDAEKQRIYDEKIYLPLCRLAEANLACHKSNENVLENGDALILDMVALATTKLPLYKSGKKSFPYFNVLCRNHLWQKCIKSYKQAQSTTSLDALMTDDDGHTADNILIESMVTHDDSPTDSRQDIFREILRGYWDRHFMEHAKGIGATIRLSMDFVLREIVFGDFVPARAAQIENITMDILVKQSGQLQK